MERPSLPSGSSKRLIWAYRTFLFIRWVIFGKPRSTMKRAVFVTGTDTGIGKTHASAHLAFALSQAGFRPGYFKAVQTGDDDDCATVKALLGSSASCQIENPAHSLKLPAAPHRAARAEGKRLDFESVVRHWNQLSNDPAWIVEGAGGLLVPMNEQENLADWIARWQLPVILVSSTRLGTINHTLLSLEACKNRGIPVLGILLNGPEDPGLEEVLNEFGGGVEILGRLPWESDAARLNPDFKLPKRVRRHFSETAPGPSTSELDLRHVWHPFTQHGLEATPLPVRRAQGPWLELEDGRRVFDGISSWWVNIHGHGRPEIAQAVAAQARTLEHVIFAGFTHAPAARLAKNLVDAARVRGTKLGRAFFSDNGSTAVEIALKLALQYQGNIGRTSKRKLLALRNSYHGDTWGSMSVSEPEGFHIRFKDLLVPVDFIEPDDLASARALLTPDSPYAAVIVEPLLQGAGSMRLYSVDFLKELSRLCQGSGTLLIADEVMTGFHRTGPLFAFEHAGIAPDLVCLSKGLTGGFLPLSVTLATDEIFQAFESRDLSQAFLHGHSYTGNPTACAAALASWELLQKPGTQNRIREISALTAERIERIRAKGLGKNPRSLGTLGAVEHPAGAAYGSDLSRKLYAAALERGVLIRPLGSTLYLLPPYCSSDPELHQAWDVLESLLQSY